MSSRDKYVPGAAQGAEVQKDGERWTLILVRELRQSPDKVWRALTDPEQLREWAPFDADRRLDTPGPIKLTTIGTPKPHVSESKVTRAEPPRLLEYGWGDHAIRWELEPMETGTRLRLLHSITRDFIAMGAAGWHICFDVLARLLAGDPIGRIVAGDAMRFDWQRLNREYAEQFGVAARQPPNRGEQR